MSEMNMNQQFRLSDDDQRVLHYLVEHEFDARSIQKLPEGEQERAEALFSMFSLLEDYPVEDGDDALVHATLAGIMRHDAAVEQTEVLEEARRARWRFPVRMPDFISIAAVILIGASIAFPVISAVRQQAIVTACADNLVTLGEGFASYAKDNEDRVPIAFAGFGMASAQWLDPLPLVKQGYCEHGHANCPGHENGPGYSYQVRLVENGRDVLWSQFPTAAVLGDRNPVIDARRSASLLPPLTNSSNHADRGQNVLMNDLAVGWLESPILGSDDNIWLVDGAEEFDPSQMPSDPADTFLAH